MIRGIHHAAISTHDFDRLIAFYRDVVGFEVIGETSWENNPTIDRTIGVPGSKARQAMLRAGGAHIEIFEYAAPAGKDSERLRPFDRGYTHICLDVVNINEEWERLTANGATFVARPTDFGEIKAVYGKDPDGNIIEIQETTPDHPTALEQLSPLMARP